MAGSLLGKLIIPFAAPEVVKAAQAATKITGILSFIINILRPIIAILTPMLRESLSDVLLKFYSDAKKTDNPWDDFLAQVFLQLLGIPIPE